MHGFRFPDNFLMHQWKSSLGRLIAGIVLLGGACGWREAPTGEAPPTSQERMFEWTFESHKHYSDPFNDVEVDVIFTNGGQSWRVPAFWRGGQRWTVRFAPPAPGEYSFRLQSTDPTDPDLNGRGGKTKILPYAGSNEALRHGMLRVSRSGRYFEYADRTPFFWLGDTWWTGLSDRISWEGFQRLAADRRAKGFTVVQIVAGLVPYEEQGPSDPGFRDEGGPVWDESFSHINPSYFDYADRRILKLLDSGITPAIVGGWCELLRQMGTARLKQHWRYIIARYGAYPAFWIAGGEVIDPPQEVEERLPPAARAAVVHGWTEVTRYIREEDPYHHPLTVHEYPPPYDYPLQDESLTDFDMFQSSHFGWPSIAAEVAQVDMHYARTRITKPIVEGEVGYEGFGQTQFESFQRAAFWLSMLNGAAGHTYGADGVFELYSGDRPLHRQRWSFLNWEDGMNLPGSYQVGLQAGLLRQYHWPRFTPHPEWVTPRGTTLLEPRSAINGFDFGPLDLEQMDKDGEAFNEWLDSGVYPGGEWAAHHGNFHLPYAAGIPGEVRFIYMPYFGLIKRQAPTVLGLEEGVRYKGYFWEPASGLRIELGAVQRPPPGPIVFDGRPAPGRSGTWIQHGKIAAPPLPLDSTRCAGTLVLAPGVEEENLMAVVDIGTSESAGLVLRYRNGANYLLVLYSSQEAELTLREVSDGHIGPALGKASLPDLSTKFTLRAEARGNRAAASLTVGANSYTTPVVNLSSAVGGAVGLLSCSQRTNNQVEGLLIRRSEPLTLGDATVQRLYDARGEHRGDLTGPGWEDFGRDKVILLDAYRPERLPTPGDWLLVLETQSSRGGDSVTALQ